jgi:hypothetical protein
MIKHYKKLMMSIIKIQMKYIKRAEKHVCKERLGYRAFMNG